MKYSCQNKLTLNLSIPLDLAAYKKDKKEKNMLNNIRIYNQPNLECVNSTRGRIQFLSSTNKWVGNVTSLRNT